MTTTEKRRWRQIARLSGAEHEQQYMHGGCPECGCFYSPEFDWQHFTGCGRATAEQPDRKTADTFWEAP